MAFKRALQAVNADALDGDTLHHALGLNPFSKGRENVARADKMKAAAARVAQWRWLIIDEISMVSANFLAELDMHIRNVMSDVNKQRRDEGNVDRAFGGLNVLLSGDFHQLDPPSGTSLRALPCAWIQKARQYAPSATEDHGQQIMWGNGGDREA